MDVKAGFHQERWFDEESQPTEFMSYDIFDCTF